MSEFYKTLNTTNLSKSQALRQVQRNLIKSNLTLKNVADQRGVRFYEPNKKRPKTSPTPTTGHPSSSSATADKPPPTPNSGGYEFLTPPELGAEGNSPGRTIPRSQHNALIDSHIAEKRNAPLQTAYPNHKLNAGQHVE